MAEIVYSGIYIEEVGVVPVPIEGVPTSITAFVGRTWRGPVDAPVRIGSFPEFAARFGGLWQDSTVSYAVKQFFENGGTDAIIVRVATRAGRSAATAARIILKDGEMFAASSPGSWGLNLKVSVDRTPAQDKTTFNLTVADDAASHRAADRRAGSGETEHFKDVSVDPASPRFVTTVLERESALLRVDHKLRKVAPSVQANVMAQSSPGTDGIAIGTKEVTAASNIAAKTGLYALGGADVFNILCIPPYSPASDLDIAKDWTPASHYCVTRRALLLVDPPANWQVADVVKQVKSFGMLARGNAALYFPRVLAADPLNNNEVTAFAPCGAIAGVMARIDAQRGVWKAPAGLEASLVNVAGLSLPVDENVDGLLNPLGVNCLRSMPKAGTVVWGARTLDGADALASEWKYVPVRRLALYLEESIDRGVAWAVFEPNAEPTWKALRLSVGAFMHSLFRAGGLQGAKEDQAYFVKCDSTTTTQADIDRGVLNIVVGFAALRPAEFILLNARQVIHSNV